VLEVVVDIDLVIPGLHALAGGEVSERVGWDRGTGAGGGEALLLIGAATMVAGGVAFRYLPKALGKSGATA
jgi:hypothetical protein